MSSDPPPVRRMTPKDMEREMGGVDKSVWQNPGLGGVPGGSHGATQPIGAVPENQRPIGPEVFSGHNPDPRQTSNGRTSPTPPTPSPSPPSYAPSASPPQASLGAAEAPSTAPSWWKPQWTPVAVAAGALAFLWWYNRNN